jgi:hypothetical protein
VPPSSPIHLSDNAINDSGQLQASSGPIGLEDLQPDVLQGVVLFLRDQDVAQLKQTSRRMRSSILQACQHWAPKVESWLMADHNSISLLGRLRDLDPQQRQPSWDQQQDAQQQLSIAAAASKGTNASAPAALQLTNSLISSQQMRQHSSSRSSSKVQITDQRQQAEAAAAVPDQPNGSLHLQTADATSSSAKLKR